MKKTFLALSLANKMFDRLGNCLIRRTVLTKEEAIMILRQNTIHSAVNCYHKASIRKLKSELGIDIPVPTKPPLVKLNQGDQIIIASLHGVARKTDYHYSEEDLKGAYFSFVMYTLA